MGQDTSAKKADGVVFSADREGRGVLRCLASARLWAGRRAGSQGSQASRRADGQAGEGAGSVRM